MNSPDIDHRPFNSVGNVSPAVQYVISELTQPPPSVNTDNVQILTSAELRLEDRIGEKYNKREGGVGEERHNIYKKRLFVGTVPAHLIILNRYYAKIIGKSIFIVSAFSLSLI